MEKIDSKIDFINKVVEKRYKPGFREFKINKEYVEITKNELKELIRDKFWICPKPIFEGLLNSNYAKKFNNKIEKYMKENGIKYKIVLGRDCNMIPGYMIGCSGDCFTVDDLNYYDIRLLFLEEIESLEYLSKRVKEGLQNREDVVKCRKELEKNFDLNEPVVICDVGCLGLQARLISDLFSIKEPHILVSYNLNVIKGVDGFDISIDLLETERYHPVESFKKFDEVIPKLSKKQNIFRKIKNFFIEDDLFLYCLTTEENIKNRTLEKTLNKIDKLI
jgi:hypothetical protein